VFKLSVLHAFTHAMTPQFVCDRFADFYQADYPRWSAKRSSAQLPIQHVEFLEYASLIM